MSRFAMPDGKVLFTAKAIGSWQEATRYDPFGKRISINTGLEEDHERLYQSSRGRYYVVRTSDREGMVPSAQYLTPMFAAAWLVLNDYQLPDNLKQYEPEIVE